METYRRAQGCWTCKKRKIGCDRGYPACNNCLRTGRECLGYGIRLAWPDQPDGRRRLSRIPDQTTHHHVVNTVYYGQQFLNSTYDDLSCNEAGLASLHISIPRGPCPIERSIPFIPDIQEKESNLLSYYQQRLSKMISTIDVNNGFRDELLPMAFSSYSSASNGLRNAILAVSAFHLWGPKQALSYKAEALRSFSSSLSSDSAGIRETQLATSMMLCVYNVFDETEGHWNIHLNGAQEFLNQLAIIHGGKLSYSFLYTWFLYHEILGGFIEPLRQWPNGPISLRLLRDSTFDRSQIIGSLGCSVEVMEIISYVNKMRAADLRGDNAATTADERASLADQWHVAEKQITSLTQRLDPRDADSLSQHERTRTLATAELYRIATFLYLQRASNHAHANESRTMFLQQAFEILRSLDVCTSPWPLFVIACEADTDEQRIEILQNLDQMDARRRIGNVLVLRSIVESFWKQQDLQADNARSQNLKWWDIDLSIAVPWFI
ncbi:fungal-specific transcription factor domain-containing protein [Xylariomycetidae sp. FL2044]|nr:fungal-specific transcription factor domain-containing protein [Xylariomycetidae sp. FL2044]